MGHRDNGGAVPAPVTEWGQGWHQVLPMAGASPGLPAEPVPGGRKGSQVQVLLEQRGTAHRPPGCCRTWGMQGWVAGVCVIGLAITPPLGTAAGHCRLGVLPGMVPVGDKAAGPSAERRGTDSPAATVHRPPTSPGTAPTPSCAVLSFYPKATPLPASKAILGCSNPSPSPTHVPTIRNQCRCLLHRAEQLCYDWQRGEGGGHNMPPP